MESQEHTEKEGPSEAGTETEEKQRETDKLETPASHNA